MRLRKFIIWMRWQPCSQTYFMPKWQLHYLTNLKGKHNSFEWNLPPTSLKGKRIKGFFLFMTVVSFKQAKSDYGKKEPHERGCCWIIKFSHCLNFEFFQFELKKKFVKWTTYDTFLRRVNFILMFFQGELASLLRAGKPFPGDLEG